MNCCLVHDLWRDSEIYVKFNITFINKPSSFYCYSDPPAGGEESYLKIKLDEKDASLLSYAATFSISKELWMFIDLGRETC